MKRNFLFLNYFILVFATVFIFSSCSSDDDPNPDEEQPVDEDPTDEEPPVSYTDYLVAHYKFDGNVEDTSPNEMDATLIGDFNEVEGIDGTAIFLNEEDSVNECGMAGGSYVQLPTIGEIWQEGFTVTAWVKFTENRKFERIVDIGNGWGEEEGLPITFSRNDTLNDIVLTSWINSDPSTNREKGRLIAKDVIKNDEFQFFAATINPSGEMKIYVDGELVAEKADGQGIVNVTRTQNFIGHSNYCEVDEDFRGAMDEVRLYNKNLPAEEITKIYSLGQ